MANSNRKSKGKASSKDGRRPSTSKKQPAKSRAAQAAAQAAQEESGIPGRVIAGLLSLSLFIILLVVFLKPEGMLPLGIRNGVQSVVGRWGSYVLLPGLLAIFLLQFTGKSTPVLRRCIDILTFVILVGAIAHLCLAHMEQNISFFAFLGALAKGGSAGTTGGILCGLLAEGVRFLLGKTIGILMLVIAAVLVLLGVFGVTVLGLYRAYRAMPNRKVREEAEVELPQDPSAWLVNQISKMSAKRKAPSQTQSEPEIFTEQHSALEHPAPMTKDNRVFDFDQTDFATIVEEPAFSQEPAPVKLELEKEQTPVPEIPSQPAKPEKVTAKQASASAAEVAQEIAQAAETVTPVYQFPPIQLLKRPSRGGGDGTEEMRENTRRLNETLASFKIDAQIINVTRGPSVTRYEVELAQGVRLNKLTTCADDIALSLGASGVRIAAVTGKIAVVGIEVPNRTVNTVSLREVIGSQDFSGAKSKSSFAVGKDIGGKCIVGDIAKLPHMLIAGTTGSGKSVCMNSIIISLLYKASPEDVKLIMVDPKMVELGIYNGIPHLLIPVVTDPKKAAGSLQWAVTEMLRRYRAMSDAGVRDLESYNSIIQAQQEGVKLPQVVVIIDELADLMLVAAKEVEESICRIAQMGRAAGIHLIIATQRPSADVITGLMKANIPSRIAFAVASAMESRIILDTQGAEKLVGKGDMLFSPIGSGKPKRIQGCFVSDSEVEAVATYVKEHYLSTYDQEVMNEIDQRAEQTGIKGGAASDPDSGSGNHDCDPVFRDAVEAILETGQASVSLLQRRLKLGYARAARVMDEMEEKGIVGPFMGSKPRNILITKEQWQAMCDGNVAQIGFGELSSEELGSDPEELS